MKGSVFDIVAYCANCETKQEETIRLDCITDDDMGKNVAAKAIHNECGDCYSCNGKIWKIKSMRKIAE